MLLNDTMLRKDSYHSGTSDSPVCAWFQWVQLHLIRHISHCCVGVIQCNWDVVWL